MTDDELIEGAWEMLEMSDADTRRFTTWERQFLETVTERQTLSPLERGKIIELLEKRS
jgi:curli biogenesis system outer membrane secretion channel CsgG